jgi:hypothetical protein
MICALLGFLVPELQSQLPRARLAFRRVLARRSFVILFVHLTTHISHQPHLTIDPTTDNIQLKRPKIRHCIVNHC